MNGACDVWHTLSMSDGHKKKKSQLAINGARVPIGLRRDDPPPCRPRSRGAKLSGGPPDKTCSVPSQREMRSTRISLARRTAFVWWVKGLCARWPWLLLCKYYQIGGAPQCGALVGDEDTEPREVM